MGGTGGSLVCKVLALAETVFAYLSNVMYILPVPKFFSQANGVGGHVAHAYGIVNGFTKLGYELDIIAEEAHPTIENDKARLHIKPIGKSSFLKRQIWGLGLIRLAKRIAQERQPLFCYVRYSVGFTPLLPLLKRVLEDIPLVLEVNSFGTQHYRFLKARFFGIAISRCYNMCFGNSA